MSSRRRLYLNLKRGFLKQFRTDAHYIKDLVGKWSQHEKPYFDGDYRGMHIQWQTPTWAPPGGTPGGGLKPPLSPWPEEFGKRTFIWDPGICSVGSIQGECGEALTADGTLGIRSPTTGMFNIVWKPKLMDPDSGKITEINPGLMGFDVDIVGEVAIDFNGTLILCLEAINVGKIRHTLVVQQVTEGYLTYEQALLLPPVQESYYEGNKYNCGCVELEIDCCNEDEFEWDVSGSGTAVNRESSTTVAVSDTPTNSASPYTWTITLDDDGEGMTLAESETEGLTNSVIADETACGGCTISVKGCNNVKEVSGDVRCTAGGWGDWTVDCERDPPFDPNYRPGPPFTLIFTNACILGQHPTLYGDPGIVIRYDDAQEKYTRYWYECHCGCVPECPYEEDSGCTCGEDEATCIQPPAWDNAECESASKCGGICYPWQEPSDFRIGIYKVQWRFWECEL